MQVERFMSARLIRACLASTSRTAPSTATSPLAAMAATLLVLPCPEVQVAAGVAYPAMVVAAYLVVVVVVAPEETVGGELVTQVVVVVAPSSMVEIVLTSTPAVADSSVVAVAAS